jgi:hypothetical protein
MMADTYIDVRSASLNRWSLKQAQYILNRQGFAALLRWPTHFPVMDNGYAFSGEYDHFFTNFASSGEAEITVENLRKSTFEEAKRAGRLRRGNFVIYLPILVCMENPYKKTNESDE